MKTNGGFLVTKIKQLGDRIFEKILSEKNIDAFNGAQGRILYVLWQEDGISIRSLSVKCGLDLYGERKATLYRSFKEGILSEQEYIAEANACATKADELRIFAHELEKEAQKYSPEYKGSVYWTELIKEYGNRTELDAAMVDALIDEVVLFNDGHYEVKLKYRDEMEELLLNAALWQKEAQRYA